MVLRLSALHRRGRARCHRRSTRKTMAESIHICRKPREHRYVATLTVITSLPRMHVFDGPLTRLRQSRVKGSRRSVAKWRRHPPQLPYNVSFFLVFAVTPRRDARRRIDRTRPRWRQRRAWLLQSSSMASGRGSTPRLCHGVRRLRRRV